MQLVLSEDQELLAKTAADFAAEHAPVSRVRALRDARDPIGYSRDLWRQMAELGWVGIPFAEQHGGADMGLAELVCVLEALGRGLAPEPFLGCVLLAGRAIQRAGSEAQQAAWLPRIASGDVVAALAYQEAGSRYDPTRIEATAAPRGSGWRLSGQKIQVLDAVGADLLVVAARCGGGIGLFLVASDATGVQVVPQTRIDHRNAALVKLDDVDVSQDAALGSPDAGGALLEEVVDYASVGLTGEMLGSMARAFELTLEHLKSREQFDAPIGSFQALKHRAANVYIEIELCRSAVMAAARAVDAGDAEAAELVSLAKARCSDAALLTANEAVQMFGGVGMTDEYDIGFYLKRARVAQQTFGDAGWHRERWARLRGY